MERVRWYSFGKGAERRNNRATIFEKTRYLHAWRVSRVDTPDTVLTTSHCYPEFRASHVAIARESVARWRNIFNGGCLGDYDLRHGIALFLDETHSSHPFRLSLRSLPLSFILHTSILSFFFSYIFDTIFENVPWKFRDLGIFGYFTIASREYHSRIVRSLTSFGCLVEIPERSWNSVNVLSKFWRLKDCSRTFLRLEDTLAPSFEDNNNILSKLISLLVKILHEN